MILEKQFTFPGKKITFPGKNIYGPWKRNLGSPGPVVLWLFGPLVLWCSGCLVLWSCGPLVLWSSGPVVLWSFGPLVLWSCDPLVLWSCDPLVLWSCGSLVLLSCSALVLWSQKFYELRANHVACFGNAFGGEALRPPSQPPSSQVQVECLNFFSRVLRFFFQGLVGVKPLNLFSRGCKFFSRAYPIWVVWALLCIFDFDLLWSSSCDLFDPCHFDQCLTSFGYPIIQADLCWALFPSHGPVVFGFMNWCHDASGVEDVEVLCQWANCFIASVHSRPHLGFSDDLDVAPHILEVDGCMGVEYVFIHNLYECTHIQNSMCI